LFDELERALAYPKLRRYIQEADAEAALRWLKGSAVCRDDADEPPAVQSGDSGDDYLIALAEKERAVIVSGDKHLLDLTDRMPVLSAAQFLELLEDR
jgi:predicted nucleic acid-binding protein